MRSASMVAKNGGTPQAMKPSEIRARWNRPSAAGTPDRRAISDPQPEHPYSVTRDGSPPKASMLSRTHRRASTMSRVPALPDSA